LAIPFQSSDGFHVELNAAAGTSAGRPKSFKKVCKFSFSTYYYLFEFNLVGQSHLLVLALDYEIVNQTEAS
jgi:hypothetical protein